MVNSGTGHDRCPSVISEPIRRPGATLRWRLRNYKNRFWFQEGVKFFLDLDRLAGALRQRGHGHLEVAPFAVSYCGPSARRGASSRFCFSQRTFSACERFSNAARSAAMAWSKPSEV